MAVNKFFLGLSVIITLGCHRSATRSSAIDTNTRVVVSGKDDKVINNSQRNYGNASISDPCEQSLLQIIQNSSTFKRLSPGGISNKLVYDINWVKADDPQEKLNGSKITNGLAVNINQGTGKHLQHLAAYIYNNDDGKLYVLNKSSKFEEDEVKVDEAALKKIRNSCYWGVASKK